jgi:hypothetical protein
VLASVRQVGVDHPQLLLELTDDLDEEAWEATSRWRI